jgi:hypothetical protein
LTRAATAAAFKAQGQQYLYSQEFEAESIHSAGFYPCICSFIVFAHYLDGYL